MHEDGILITTTPIDKYNYMVDISNPFTKKSITVEYYTTDAMNEYEIGMAAFKDLLTSSALGMVKCGTNEKGDFYKSSLHNMREVMSDDDIWGGINGDDNCTMYNA